MVKSNYYALAQEAGAFVVSGGDVDTLADVLEAIAHLHEVPEAERGTAWYAYRDTLESKRAGLTGTDVDPSLVRP